MKYVCFNVATGALVSLLVSLVSRDVTCCQQSHLAVFFAAYGATLSVTGLFPSLFAHNTTLSEQIKWRYSVYHKLLTWVIFIKVICGCNRSPFFGLTVYKLIVRNSYVHCMARSDS